jgi:hypothetical protein
MVGLISTIEQVRVVLWVEGWYCGSRRVVLWIEKVVLWIERGGAVDREGWCCGSKGGVLELTLYLTKLLVPHCHFVLLVVSKAVRRKYFSGDADYVKQQYTFWHGRLADYFEHTKTKDTARRAEELPHHLEKVP